MYKWKMSVKLKVMFFTAFIQISCACAVLRYCRFVPEGRSDLVGTEKHSKKLKKRSPSKSHVDFFCQ